MEQNTDISDTTSAQPANAELSDGATEDKPHIGKFTSVDALYRAYERLEAEFTRRSQRLKALEEGVSDRHDETTGKTASSKVVGNGADASADGGDAAKAIADTTAYDGDGNKPDGAFRSADDDGRPFGTYSPANFCKGSALVAPPLRPRTLAEAGELAKLYIKYKGEI